MAIMVSGMAATSLCSMFRHSSFSSSSSTQVCWMEKKGRGVGFASSSPTAVPRARLVARRCETAPVQQLQRPLLEYMGLPASQYSVLDAERIERLDDDTFRCFVYRFKFFAFEVCPVLLVRVEQELNGCCIRLLSCKLEGSPIVVAQNDKFSGR